MGEWLPLLAKQVSKNLNSFNVYKARIFGCNIAFARKDLINKQLTVLKEIMLRQMTKYPFC